MVGWSSVVDADGCLPWCLSTLVCSIVRVYGARGMKRNEMK